MNHLGPELRELSVRVVTQRVMAHVAEGSFDLATGIASVSGLTKLDTSWSDWCLARIPEGRHVFYDHGGAHWVLRQRDGIWLYEPIHFQQVELVARGGVSRRNLGRFDHQRSVSRG